MSACKDRHHARPRKANKKPITRDAATINAHCAIVSGFASTAVTDAIVIRYRIRNKDRNPSFSAKQTRAKDERV
jgi:hypothetical protein